MGKFFRGLFFGGLLGFGTAFLNYTKQGKELKIKMAMESYQIAKRAILSIPKNEFVDSKKLDNHLKKFVEEYSRGKDLTKTVKKFIFGEVKKRISEMRKNV